MSSTHFFSEMPYAAALHPDLLSTRCWYCFSVDICGDQSGKKCENECEYAAYCNQSCHDSDRVSHSNECLAYKKLPKSFTPTVNTRLVGRILTRRKADQGVADLSTDFPKHLAKNRRLDDLISHTRELEKTQGYHCMMYDLYENFAEFFEPTELAWVKQSEFAHYDATRINGFSITWVTNSNPSSLIDFGEAVYLNASRFNHSCRPSLLFSFNGCRIVVKRMHYQDDAKNWNGKCDGMTKKQFKNLTFNYGFGSVWNYGMSMCLTSQRQRSLKERYFFTCRCELCRDRRLGKLQSNSSNIPCGQCGQPYVWKCKNGHSKTPVSLKKSCKCCGRDQYADEMMKRPDVRIDLLDLENLWTSSMKSSVELLWYEQCGLESGLQKARELAKQFWNPKSNLRYGLLHEKIMYAYLNQMAIKRNNGQVYERELIAALESGEEMLKSYLPYSMLWDLTVASVLYLMANRYALFTEKSKRQRASELYTLTAPIWKISGAEECEKFMIQLALDMLNDCHSTEALLISDETQLM